MSTSMSVSFHDGFAPKIRVNTPYNTGKVQIGASYERPTPIPDRDAVLLQASLLDPVPSTARKLFSWFL